MRNEIKQERAEGQEKENHRKPGEHEIAFVLAGRRRGDAEHEMDSAEDAGEEFNHETPCRE